MTTTTKLDPETLATLELGHGSHHDRRDGVCFKEAVSWAAGEPHSDHPDCVSPVLNRFGIALNDRLSHEHRQLLKSFVFEEIGTAGDGLDDQRRALLRQWVTQKALPEWLELAKLPELAAKVRAAGDLSESELRVALREVRDLTWQARDAKWEPFRARVKAAYSEALTVELQKRGFAGVAGVAAVAEVARAAVGRKVIYGFGGWKDGVEEGVITSVNETFVFVRYGADHGSKATPPEALTLLSGESRA